MDEISKTFLKKCLLRKIKDPDLEIEVRFKHVTPMLFNTFLEHMLKTDKSSFYSEQMDKISNQYRHITRCKNNKLLVVEKWKLDVLQKQGYNIVLSSEKILKSATQLPTSQITKIRNKYRWSFMVSNVRLDLTKVVDEEHQLSFEIEIEILEAQTAHTLQRVQHLVALVISYFPHPSPNHCISKFMGAMPTTLTRQNLNLLHSYSYFVTPKLDGERVLVLRDKDGSFHTITRQQQKGCCLPDETKYTIVNPFSIFDAEWYKGDIYLFDVIVFEGRDLRKDSNQCHTMNLCARMELVQLQVKQWKHHNIKFKPHFPTNSLDEYNQFKETLDTDGLIFTRSDTLYPSTSRTLDVLKWKPLEFQSIDFFIQKTNQGKTGFQTWLLFIRQPNGVKLFKPLPTILVSRELSDQYEDHSIVECAWDEIGNTFFPVRARTDKANPNFISSAQDVLDAISNPVANPICALILNEKHNLKKKEDKAKSSLFLMRRRHNEIKRHIIKEMVQKAHCMTSDLTMTSDSKCDKFQVLDIGCGRGGDLRKWMASDISPYINLYVGTDCNELSLTEAKRRYKPDKISNSHQVMFWSMDWTTDNLPDHIVNKLKLETQESKNKPTLVTCQFALHYFWKSKATWDHFIHQVNRVTSPGSIFSCSLFEAGKVLQYLNGRSHVRALDAYGTGFMLKLSECGFSIENEATFPAFGIPLNVRLFGDDEVIMKDATIEYLVFAGDLAFMMQQVGWKLIKCESFKDLINEDTQKKVTEIDSWTQTIFSDLNYYYIFERI